MADFGKFEEKIGYAFANKRLLKQAFTHRSYINEHRESGLSHNERLEFLGDAVLELVITRYLFDRYPDATEGELTSYRAALVNTNTLSDTARNLGAEEFLLLSKGEARDTGRARAYILADTYESIVGALYLDGGYDAAHDFIENTLFHKTEEMVKKGLWRDAKSLFQERAQEKLGITPVYRVVSESGPDHDKEFVTAVYLKDEKVAEDSGKSKQESEQRAASLALRAKGWEA